MSSTKHQAPFPSFSADSAESFADSQMPPLLPKQQAPMAVKNQKKFEILRRRQQVAELYVQRHSQAAIAEKLSISQATVSADIKHISSQWRASTVRDFDSACELELQQLDRVEREAWQLFERSQKPAQSATMGDGHGSATRKSIKNRDGDIRALDVILKCGNARRALLGLDAPTR